jgi:PST family polysaccharide transporter
LPVAGLLLVFAPLGVLQTLYAPISLIYSTQGRTDIQFHWQIFASISYVLSFIAGLRWGIMGVATSYAIVWTVLMLPSFLIPFRLIGLSLNTFFFALWPMACYGLVMVTVAGSWLYSLRLLGLQNPALQLVSTAVIGAVVYIGLVLWRKPPVLYELSAVLQGSSSRPIKAVAQLIS